MGVGFNRITILGLSLAGLLIVGLQSGIAAEAGKLTISTWSGAYQKAKERAIFKPFTKESGIKIKVKNQDGSLDKLQSWYRAGKAPMDVIDISSHTAELACDRGYLVSLNADDISPGANNESIEQDFLANRLLDCAVPNAAWSGLLAVKADAFEKAKPRRWADFFNVKKFPGKRSLRNSARYNLEIALLADGVDKEDIYAELSEEAGLKRAFKKLNEIRNDIVWWESGEQSIEMLRKKDVVMGFAFNGRLFNAIVGDGLDLTLIWQGQIYDVDYWAIPKYASARPEARKFIQFATTSKHMAAPSKWYATGPMRHSSMQFIGRHKIIDMHMGAFIPTTKAHFQHAVKFKEGWWLSNDGQRAEEWFLKWLKNELDLADEAEADGE